VGLKNGGGKRWGGGGQLLAGHLEEVGSRYPREINATWNGKEKWEGKGIVSLILANGKKCSQFGGFKRKSKGKEEEGLIRHVNQEGGKGRRGGREEEMSVGGVWGRRRKGGGGVNARESVVVGGGGRGETRGDR